MEERGKATTSHTVTVLFEGVRTPINALLVSFQKVKPNGLPHYPGIWKHSSVGYLSNLDCWQQLRPWRIQPGLSVAFKIKIRRSKSAKILKIIYPKSHLSKYTVCVL